MSATIIRRQLLLIGHADGIEARDPGSMEWGEWPHMSGLSADESRRVFEVMESLNWVVGFPNKGWITYKLTGEGADHLKHLTRAGAGAVQIPLNEEQIKVLDGIDGNGVFIVHSDDPNNPGLAQEVKNFITGVTGKEAKMLQPDLSRTLWDEFEKQASDCNAAVCIWSKDRKNSDALHIRPNVLLETGYFLSRLGRSKVIIIREDENLNAPSDLAGIVWATKSNWRERLPQALRGALAEPSPELPPAASGANPPRPTAEPQPPAERQPHRSTTRRQSFQSVNENDVDDLPF